MENKMSKFVHVREYIYGWDFTERPPDGKVFLHDTYEEALDELKDYIRSINHAFEIGDMSEPYQNDCSIAEVEVTPDGEVKLLSSGGLFSMDFEPVVL